MMASDPAQEEQRLLGELEQAIARAPGPVKEIEVGLPLSIALGRRRPSVSCGGCSTPLEYRGIPARTTLGMTAPFRLILDTPGHAT
jgi:hypothetical protein